jgi:hypothetical protein
MVNIFATLISCMSIVLFADGTDICIASSMSVESTSCIAKKPQTTTSTVVPKKRDFAPRKVEDGGQNLYEKARNIEEAALSKVLKEKKTILQKSLSNSENLTPEELVELFGILKNINNDDLFAEFMQAINNDEGLSIVQKKEVFKIMLNKYDLTNPRDLQSRFEKELDEKSGLLASALHKHNFQSQDCVTDEIVDQ